MSNVKERNGLTLTVVVEGDSLNYGESLGNTTPLKKITRFGNDVFTYVSSNALKFSIKQVMGVDNTPATNYQKVAQYHPDVTIEDSAEIDLFGYMKTSKNTKTRKAPARVNTGVSLETYDGTVDFSTNAGLASRGDENGNPIPTMIAMKEVHHSLYCYTVTVDLEAVGIDENDGIELSNEEKAKRVISFIEGIFYLYRDVKGEVSNLMPLFVVGGLYERKNPYFKGRIKLVNKSLVIKNLKRAIENNTDVKEHTLVGLDGMLFDNDDEIEKEFGAIAVSEVRDKLIEEVRNYYA